MLSLLYCIAAMSLLVYWIETKEWNDERHD